MAALTQARMPLTRKLNSIPLPLAGSTSVFQGGMACADTSAGVVTKGGSSTTLVRIGTFAETLDNSASTATTQILVDLEREVTATWYDNATGANAVVASDLFSTTTVYILDDHTVTKASSGNSLAGRVWGVDSVKGVLVEAFTL